MTWPAILLAFIVITVSPGPGNLLTLNLAATNGAAAASLAAVGLLATASLWLFVIGLGAGVVIESVPALLPVLTLCGGVYLGWLGLRIIRSDARATRSEKANGARERHLWSGVMVTATNAKLVALLVAAIPPLMAGAEDPVARSLFLALVYFGVGATWHTCLGLFGTGMRAWLLSPLGRRRFAFLSGMGFTGFGVLLAYDGFRLMI